jgi:hypothetical protein
LILVVACFEILGILRPVKKPRVIVKTVSVHHQIYVCLQPIGASDSAMVAAAAFCSASESDGLVFSSR